MLLNIFIMAVVTETTSDWERYPHMRIRLAWATGVYVLIGNLLSCPLTRFRIDTFFVIVAAGQFLLAATDTYHSVEEFTARAFFIANIRILVSVFHMDWRSSACVNFFYSSGSCCILAIIRPGLDRSFLCIGLMGIMITWLMTTALCIITQHWITEMLHNEVVANLAKRDADKLLSGLCDSVVRLDSGLRIKKASPHLMHLLCPAASLDPASLEGTRFSNIVHEPDKKIFDKFISSAAFAQSNDAAGLVPALRINLQYESGPEVPVQLFHVHSLSADCEAQHLVGLREAWKDGVAPDESLHREGNMSFTDRFASIASNSRQSSRKSTRSSRSSPSSSQVSMEAVKRKIKGLEKIQFVLDTWETDLGILEYRLCAKQDLKFEPAPPDSMSCPSVFSCLANPKGPNPFVVWLQRGVNELVYNDDDQLCLEYSDAVTFRPPNIACASPKVVLCAEGARLFHSGGTEPDSVSLELCGIYQLVTHQITCKSEPEILPSLPEVNIDT